MFDDLARSGNVSNIEIDNLYDDLINNKDMSGTVFIGNLHSFESSTRRLIHNSKGV